MTFLCSFACDHKRVYIDLNSACLIASTGTVYNGLATRNKHSSNALRAIGANPALREIINEKQRQVS